MSDIYPYSENISSAGEYNIRCIGISENLVKHNKSEHKKVEEKKKSHLEKHIKIVHWFTFASAAGFTFPFTENAPPRRIICWTFLTKSGSDSMACMNQQISEKRKEQTAEEAMPDPNQCNICQRTQCHDCDLSGVKIYLLGKKFYSRLLNLCPFWWRKVLISQSIGTMHKISNPKFCTFLYMKWVLQIVPKYKLNDSHRISLQKKFKKANQNKEKKVNMHRVHYFQRKGGEWLDK